MVGSCIIILFVVFFFKQKTAYEMRISDWSSDVCSSDLAEADDGAVDPIIGEEGLARKDRRGESARDARDPAGFVPAYRLEQAMRRHAEGRQTVEDRPIEAYAPRRLGIGMGRIVLARQAIDQRLLRARKSGGKGKRVLERVKF